MRFEIERGETSRTLRLIGEFDVAVVDEFTGEVSALSNASGDVTLDLTDLRFIDSSGLRAIISLARSLQGRGRVVLRSPDAAVRRVFDVVQIATIPNVTLVLDAAEDG